MRRYCLDELPQLFNVLGGTDEHRRAASDRRRRDREIWRELRPILLRKARPDRPMAGQRQAHCCPMPSGSSLMSHMRAPGALSMDVPDPHGRLFLSCCGGATNDARAAPCLTPSFRTEDHASLRPRPAARFLPRRRCRGSRRSGPSLSKPMNLSVDTSAPLSNAPITALDRLNITVFREPDLSVVDAGVDESGRLILPLVGAVTAAGKSTEKPVRRNLGPVAAIPQEPPGRGHRQAGGKPPGHGDRLGRPARGLSARGPPDAVASGRARPGPVAGRVDGSGIDFPRQDGQRTAAKFQPRRHRQGQG